MTAPERLLYSVDQAADALGGMSRSRLYGLLADGTLASVRLGRRRLIPADALRAYVASLPEAPP